MRSGYFLTKADFSPADDGLKKPLDEEVRKIIYNITGEWYSVERVHAGTFHFIFRARHNQRLLFLKIAQYRELTSSLRVEEYLYRSVLDRSGIGVRILGSHFEDDPYSFPYILLSGAAGACLRDMDFSDPGFPGMVAAAGRALSNLHKYTGVAGFGLIDPDSIGDAEGLTGSQPAWNEYIFLNLGKHLDYLHAEDRIDPRILEEAGQILNDNTRILEYHSPGRLLHGDPGSHNIFIHRRSNDLTCSIIDWEDSLLGDPVFDLAAFGSFFRMHEFLDSLIRGYSTINSGPLQDNDFRLRLWLYYLRIVLAKGVLRFKLGYDIPGNSLAEPKIILALEKLRSL